MQISVAALTELGWNKATHQQSEPTTAAAAHVRLGVKAFEEVQGVLPEAIRMFHVKDAFFDEAESMQGGAHE